VLRRLAPAGCRSSFDNSPADRHLQLKSYVRVTCSHAAVKNSELCVPRKVQNRASGQQEHHCRRHQEPNRVICTARLPWAVGKLSCGGIARSPSSRDHSILTPPKYLLVGMNRENPEPITQDHLVCVVELVFVGKKVFAIRSSRRRTAPATISRLRPPTS
jgi:hypothetical protein